MWYFCSKICIFRMNNNEYVLHVIFIRHLTYLYNVTTTEWHFGWWYPLISPDIPTVTVEFLTGYITRNCWWLDPCSLGFGWCFTCCVESLGRQLTDWTADAVLLTLRQKRDPEIHGVTLNQQWPLVKQNPPSPCETPILPQEFMGPGGTWWISQNQLLGRVIAQDGERMLPGAHGSRFLMRTSRMALVCWNGLLRWLTIGQYCVAMDDSGWWCLFMVNESVLLSRGWYWCVDV